MQPTTEHQYSTFVCSHCGHQIQIPVRCGNRFCDVCGRRTRLKARHRITELVKFVQLLPTDSIKFLTLTIPNQPDPRTALRQLQLQFRRLRQTRWWKSRVRGGYVVYEMTVSKTGEWHVHLHAIIESAFLPYRELSERWSNSGAGKVVYIQRIPLGAVIAYVTKYITKTGLDLTQQFEASEMLRGMKLFQPFGLWFHLDQQLPKYVSECPACRMAAWVYLRPGMSVGDCIGSVPYFDPDDYHPNAPPIHQYDLLPSAHRPPR